MSEADYVYHRYDASDCPLEGGFGYIEYRRDARGVYATRQVEENDGRFITSVHKCPHGGPCLTDVGPPEADLEISQREFNAVWERAMRARAADWHRAKEKHPVGTKVQGRVLQFHPDDVLVDFGGSILGALKRSDFRAVFGPVTGVVIHGQVVAHDDGNHLLRLSLSA